MTWWNNPCWQAQTSDSLVVGHQVYTHLRRDFGPLLFADPLQILKVAFSMGGNEGMRFKPNIPRYMDTSIVPSMQWSRPVPLAEKQPQHNVSTSMLDGGDGVHIQPSSPSKRAQSR